MRLGVIDFSEKHANIGTLFWATVHPLSHNIACLINVFLHCSFVSHSYTSCPWRLSTPPYRAAAGPPALPDMVLTIGRARVKSKLFVPVNVGHFKCLIIHKQLSMHTNNCTVADSLRERAGCVRKTYQVRKAELQVPSPSLRSEFEVQAVDCCWRKWGSKARVFWVKLLVRFCWVWSLKYLDYLTMSCVTFPPLTQVSYEHIHICVGAAHASTRTSVPEWFICWFHRCQH